MCRHCDRRAPIASLATGPIFVDHLYRCQARTVCRLGPMLAMVMIAVYFDLQLRSVPRSRASSNCHTTSFLTFTVCGPSLGAANRPTISADQRAHTNPQRLTAWTGVLHFANITFGFRCWFEGLGSDRSSPRSRSSASRWCRRGGRGCRDRGTDRRRHRLHGGGLG